MYFLELKNTTHPVHGYLDWDQLGWDHLDWEIGWTEIIRSGPNETKTSLRLFKRPGIQLDYCILDYFKPTKLTVL